MKTQVNILEFERGWGSKVDEVKYFDTPELVSDFCKEYNKGNNLSYVPDWYMKAVVVENI